MLDGTTFRKHTLVDNSLLILNDFQQLKAHLNTGGMILVMNLTHGHKETCHVEAEYRPEDD